MNELKIRLKKEQLELGEKIREIKDFMVSDKSDEIRDVQKALLKLQLSAMDTYLRCLEERIKRM